MAINAEQLNIILAARDKEFTKAMDRSQKRVERFAKQSQKNLSKTTQSFSGLSVAAGKLGAALSTGAMITGMGKAIDNATRLAIELDNLSRLSGTSVQTFQELSYASKQMGIEQDKLADILKDVNDKFGDYMATGAGPLADFFDNIAPKVGLAKDAFVGLSSDQALGKYVKALQDAGVNQQEMTFYMEALASDATALAPLFYNNSEALGVFAQSARDAGAVIDTDLIEKSVKLRRRWDAVLTAMTTKFNTFALNVAIGLDEIFNMTDDAVYSDLNKDLDASISKLQDLQQQAQNYAEAYGDTPSGAQKKILQEIQNSIDAESQNYQRIVDAMNAIRDKPMNLPPIVLDPEDDPEKDPKIVPTTVDNLDAIISAYDALAGRLDPVIAATNQYAKAQKTVNDALASGLISQDQASATLEKAKQELDLATGAAFDLSSVFDSMQTNVESAFMGIIDGTASAKDAFKSMAAEVIKELYRVLVVQQLVGSFSTGGGGILGAIAPIFGRASGGSVKAGQPYMTGEHGRELFVPQTNGRVLSAAQTNNAASGGSGGGVVVNQTINVSTGVQQTVRTEIKQLMPQIAESAKSAVVDAKLRGGSYGRSFA